MGQIATEGIYRGSKGSVVDFGLDTTKGDFPQLILLLRAEEIYDEEEDVWVSLENSEETDAIAYLVLFGSDDCPIFHIKSVQKVFGWDGISFASLMQVDWQNTPIQWRVEPSTYGEQTRLKVAGIDTYDADPHRTIQKLDTQGVRKLDQKYALAFKKLAGANRSAAPVGKPTIPGKGPANAETSSKTKATTNKPPTKTSTKTSKANPPDAAKEPACSQEEAWGACIKAKPESVTVEDLQEKWFDAINVYAPDGDDSKMTDVLWAQVRDAVVKQVSDDIPF